MSGSTLAVVAVAAGLIDLAHVEPLISGGVLLIGSLVVVLVAVRFAARSHGAGKGDATPGQLETPGANRHAGETSRDGLLGSRSEEHTSELQSLMRTSYAVFCLKKKN